MVLDGGEYREDVDSSSLQFEATYSPSIGTLSSLVSEPLLKSSTGDIVSSLLPEFRVEILLDFLLGESDIPPSLSYVPKKVSKEAERLVPRSPMRRFRGECTAAGVDGRPFSLVSGLSSSE